MRRARFGEGSFCLVFWSVFCLYSVLFCPSVHSVESFFFVHLFIYTYILKYVCIVAVCVIIIFLEITVNFFYFFFFWGGGGGVGGVFRAVAFPEAFFFLFQLRVCRFDLVLLLTFYFYLFIC